MFEQAKSEARSRLIFELEQFDFGTSIELMRKLIGFVSVVKIGIGSIICCGPEIINAVKGFGFDVFLDLRLYDTPENVSKSIKILKPYKISMVSLNTAGGYEMIREAAGVDRSLFLVGYNLLPGFPQADLTDLAIYPDGLEVVRARSSVAIKAGCRGIFCQPQEIKTIREQVGKELVIFTPWEGRDTKKETAIKAGADYVVVGKAISQDKYPMVVAEKIVNEIDLALRKRLMMGK